MATQLLAIDAHKTAVHVVRIHTTLRQASVTHAQTYGFAEDETLEELVARIAEDHNDVNQIILSAPEGRTTSRLLFFPFADMRKVEQVIDFELEGQVPQALESLLRSWSVAERGKEHTTVLALTCPKEDLDQQLSLFTDADIDLDPRVIVPAAIGLTAFADVGAPKDEITARLHVGDTCSELLVTRGTVPLMVRSIRHGAWHIDKAIAKAFNVDGAKATYAREHEANLVQPAIASSDTHALQLRTAVEVGLAGLLRGLASTFKSLPLSCAPQRLSISGSVSAVPGFFDYIGHKLGMPVTPLNIETPLQTLESAVEVQPEQTIALGLALSMYQRGRQLPLNLRVGDFAYSADLNLYRGEAIRLAVGLAAVFILALVGMGVRLGALNAQERDLDEGFCQATEKIVGQRICDVTRAMAVLGEAPSEGGVVIPEYSAAQIFEMISKAVPQELDLTFGQLDFRLSSNPGDPDRINGKGEAADFDTIDKAVAALQKTSCIKKVEITRRRKTRKSGRVEFNISVNVNCAAGERPGADLPEVASARSDEEQIVAGDTAATKSPMPAVPPTPKAQVEAQENMPNDKAVTAADRIRERRETRRKMLDDLRRRGADAKAQRPPEDPARQRASNKVLPPDAIKRMPRLNNFRMGNGVAPVQEAQ